MHHLALNKILRHSPSIAVTLLLLALGACSQLPRPSSETSWDHHQAQLQGLQHWSFQGKLAIRSRHNAYNLRVRWQQQKNDFTLQLSGPLGLQPVTITYRESGELFMSRNGQITNYESAAALASAVPELTEWGAYIPALPNWLKGIPHTVYPIKNISLSNHKLSSIEQMDWRIEYQKYKSINSFQLPTKITVVRGEIEAKIVINHWLIADTDND